LIFNLNGGSEKIIINEPTNSSLKRKEMGEGGEVKNEFTFALDKQGTFSCS
jgi:hypothetical protein